MDKIQTSNSMKKKQNRYTQTNIKEFKKNKRDDQPLHI